MVPIFWAILYMLITRMCNTIEALNFKYMYNFQNFLSAVKA